MITSNKDYHIHSFFHLLNEKEINMWLLSSRLVVLQSVNSTNQYLIEHMPNLKQGDVCVAEYQEQGRGRRGRKWISPFGRNIYLSFYWRFKKEVEVINCLSLMVGVVIAEVLQRFGINEVRIKWPNDLYLNDRKLAGILIESFIKTNHFTHVIIGTGINIGMLQSEAKEIQQKWITLQQVGYSINRNFLIVELVNTLFQELLHFEYQGFFPFLNRWKTLDNFYNRAVKISINQRNIKGISRGINSKGELLLEIQGKIKPYLDGEISFNSI